METIINYLENMFRNLPNTQEMRKLKEEILSNMEDKYHELKANGKSENEAIGIVISEFGNIDELVEEFELDQSSGGNSLPTMTDTEAENYLEVNRKSAKLIGFGVFLTILASMSPILSLQFIEEGILTFANESFGEIVGLIPLFILIIIAIILFIYAGISLERYKHIQHGVEISSAMKLSVQQRLDRYQPTYIRSMAIGLVLLFLSPLVLIIMSTIGDTSVLYGVSILLLMVAIAIYIFVYTNMIKDSYKKLLKIGEFSKRHREQNRVIAGVSAIIWPLVVCIYLITGFIFDLWHINWLVFPIAGLLFSMFSESYKIFSKREKKA